MTTDITNSTLWHECLIYGHQNYIICSLILLVAVMIIQLPSLILCCCWYSINFFLVICKKLFNLPEDVSQEGWNRILYFLASAINIAGKVLHGYEVYGNENLPEGPGLIIFYHGSPPVDYMFFMNKLYTTGKECFTVVDNIFYYLPGTKLIRKVYRFLRTREECIEVLKKGHLVGISPGGLREHNYGDNTYRLIWEKRKGFAQVAIDAKVPIIPMFTQNIREGYRTYGNIWLMRWLYEKTRFIVFPTLGPIPVKLRTYIGEPIPYDPNITAEELVEKTKTAIEALRDKHQEIPGCIRTALWERFKKHHKTG